MIGLYAGSFDPVHLGHMAVIRSASVWLERLFVLVAANQQKRTGLFGAQERVAMLAGECAELPNVTVMSHGGLVVDVAERLRVDVLVRSAGKEHADEKQMGYMNGLDGFPTLLVAPEPELSYISSSLVRSLIAVEERAALHHLVPVNVLAALDGPVPTGRLG